MPTFTLAVNKEQIIYDCTFKLIDIRAELYKKVTIRKCFVSCMLRS
jgi:hypothetical protein